MEWNDDGELGKNNNIYKYKTSISYNFICPHRHTFFTLKIIIFCKRTYDFEGAIKINSYIIQNNLHVYIQCVI